VRKTGAATQRLDLLLVERGLAPSRQAAQAYIMAGGVLVAGQRVDKAGQVVPMDASVDLVATAPRYVSRGGLKLEHALSSFNLSPRDLVALDVGASTGGFTDCLLQHGASRVVAVDVGHGQLHQKLRDDPRVIVLEQTNARTLTVLPERPECCTMDVSFISALLVLPAVVPLLVPGAWMVVLIKPQFEAGARHLRKGVVRDASVRRETVARVLHGCVALGLSLGGLTESPLLGPAGNHEYLVHARLAGEEEGYPVDRLVASITW